MESLKKRDYKTDEIDGHHNNTSDGLSYSTNHSVKQSTRKELNGGRSDHIHSLLNVSHESKREEKFGLKKKKHNLTVATDTPSTIASASYSHISTNTNGSRSMTSTSTNISNSISTPSTPKRSSSKYTLSGRVSIPNTPKSVSKMHTSIQNDCQNLISGNSSSAVMHTSKQNDCRNLINGNSSNATSHSSILTSLISLDLIENVSLMKAANDCDRNLAVTNAACDKQFQIGKRWTDETINLHISGIQDDRGSILSTDIDDRGKGNEAADVRNSLTLLKTKGRARSIRSSSPIRQMSTPSLFSTSSSTPSTTLVSSQTNLLNIDNSYIRNMIATQQYTGCRDKSMGKDVDKGEMRMPRSPCLLIKPKTGDNELTDGGWEGSSEGKGICEDKRGLVEEAINFQHKSIPTTPSHEQRQNVLTSHPPLSQHQSENQTECNKHACLSCGRTFDAEPFERHSKICSKIFSKKREAFNSAHMRQGVDGISRLKEQQLPRGKQIEIRTRSKGSQFDKKSTNASYSQSRSFTSSKSTTQIWRAQSESFREALRAAKGVNIKPFVDPSLVPCPNCSRRFNIKAAERHIPVCSKIIAKPTMLRRGTGRGQQNILPD